MSSQDVVDTGRGPSPPPGPAIEKFKPKPVCPVCGSMNIIRIKNSWLVDKALFCVHCANGRKEGN